MARALVFASIVLFLGACTGIGGNSADVLDVDLQPRIVGSPHWDASRCSDRCFYHFRVRVRNTGERAVWVAQCSVDARAGDGSTVSDDEAVVGEPPAGTILEPGTSAILDGTADFDAGIRRVDVSRVACAAWDWHDNPPA